MFPDLFCEVTVILILKSNEAQQKTTVDQYSQSIKMQKSSIKYLEVIITNTLKRSYGMIKSVSFQVFRSEVIQHINGIKDGNYISIDGEKAFDKIQHPL